jgi:hypothetical protein
MKKSMLILFFLVGFLVTNGQISITADSMVVSRWDVAKGGNVPIVQVKENMSMEIDKDLLTLRIFGKTAEMAYIEKAYIIDFLEANNTKDKWLFQGSDKNCVPCTITLDVKKKKISFITFGKDSGIDKPLMTTYYNIVDIKINNDAIDKHLKEKGDRKF